MVPMRRAKWQSTLQGGNTLSLLAARQSHGRSPRAQQAKRVRRIGVLMTLTADGALASYCSCRD